MSGMNLYKSLKIIRDSGKVVEKIRESAEPDYEDGRTWGNIYLTLLDEDGRPNETSSDPENRELVPEDELDSWISKLKSQWEGKKLMFSHYHDPNEDTLVIHYSPVYGSEDKCQIRSRDWKLKSQLPDRRVAFSDCKAWDVVWY